MNDFYAPEMANPGDGDMFGALASAACDVAGHIWQSAGGGMLICACCEATRWDDSLAPPRNQAQGDES